MLKFDSSEPRTRVIFPRTAFASSSSAMARGKKLRYQSKTFGFSRSIEEGVEEEYFLMLLNFSGPVQPKNCADANVCL